MEEPVPDDRIVPPALEQREQRERRKTQVQTQMGKHTRLGAGALRIGGQGARLFLVGCRCRAAQALANGPALLHSFTPLGCVACHGAPLLSEPPRTGCSPNRLSSTRSPSPPLPADVCSTRKDSL